MNLSDLKANEKNPRRISEKKLEMLKKSVQEFGSLDGVIYNRLLGRLVGGHQRQKIDPAGSAVTIERQFSPPTPAGTVAEGFVTIAGERFPYREVEWEEAKDKAANIAANKGAGQWDLPQLREWMLELDSLNFDLDLTLFDDEERQNLIVPTERVPPAGDADNVPGLSKDPITKRGDLWRLGDHLLLCGDSLLVDDVKRLMGDDLADMMFTDPPYGVSYKGGSKKRADIENDELVGENLKEFLLTAFSNAWAYTRAGAAAYISHADLERVAFTQAFVEAGFKLSSVIVWAKNNSTFGRQDYFWKHEPILYGWNSSGAHIWHGPNTEDTVWAIDRPSRSEEHPTMKPVELVERAIRNSTQPMDRVLDLFGGSGSTLIACEKSTRRCHMMELSPGYCDVIVRRWEQYTGLKAELMAP